MHDVTKIGPLERCNHRPCVCGGLGGYTKITEVEQMMVGWRTLHEGDDGWVSYGTNKAVIYEDVFSYSWLKARRMT